MKTIRPQRRKRTTWRYGEEKDLLRAQLSDVLEGFSREDQSPDEVFEIRIVGCQGSPGGPEVVVEAGYTGRGV
jgi:hypothetical protein